VRLMQWTFAVCLFTASCDIILSFNLAGQIRLCQILMVLVCMGAVARIMQEGRILWPRGGTALMLWLMGQMFLVPNALNFGIAIKFFGLLAFTVLGVFAVIQLYGESEWYEPLMRLYLLSFIAIAGFGLLQFTLPLLGLPSPLVQQWLLHGKLARINGFSYEPSYYVTYLFIGWITLLELRISRASIVQGRFWKWATLLVGASVFLSTSKTAWIFMVVELVARLSPLAWKGLRAAFYQYRLGRIPVYLPRLRFLLAAAGVLVIAVVGAAYITSKVDPLIFLAGTGLAGTAGHSRVDRYTRFLTTWEVFKQHPFIGPSLGGVPVYIASRSGIVVESMSELRAYWGFPVLMDVLAASGIFVFIPFLVFLYTTTIGALRMARRFWPEERAKWLRALARAMIFEWLLLLSDQNVLRTYLWFHITMVMLAAYQLEFVRVPVHSRRASSPEAFPATGQPLAL
jgi:hypothetical protein